MRQAVRGIIIENNRVLLIKREKLQKIYWVFPGGGVEEGETNEEALIREMEEEVGVKVKIISLYSKCSIFFEEQVKKEFFYFCQIKDGKIGTGNGPEFQKNNTYEGTHIFEWVPVEKIDTLNVYPEEISHKLYCDTNHK